MTMEFWIRVIDLTVNLLSVLLLVDILASYFLAPFHPVRRVLDNLYDPMLAPIRRILPSAGMFDFSPIVLAVILQLAGALLIRLVGAMA